MLNFKKHEASGQLMATGKNGQYWIEDAAWAYLTAISYTEKGPVVSKPETFDSIEDAQIVAAKLEKNATPLNSIA